MTIDAHLHVWDLARAEYAWLTAALTPIDRSIDLGEVLPELERAGIDQVVLVQSADEVGDTEKLFEVAAARPIVGGVVAYLPLHEPESAVQRLESLQRESAFVGVRNLIHDRADPDWILTAAVDAGLGVLEAAGVPFDYVTSGPDALRRLPIVSERHPQLRIVVDHLGKPPIGGDPEAFRDWRARIAEVAENPLVFAKISGLYADSRLPDQAAAEQLRPFVSAAHELFGSQRLMYGGDWPISVLSGGYARSWWQLFSLFDEWSEVDRTAVLEGTARVFYGLPTVGGVV